MVLGLGLFSLEAAPVVVAAQRGAVAPSMGHAMAPAPAVGAHAASLMHAAPPVAHGAPVHAGTHGAAGARAVTTSHNTMSGKPVTPQPRNTNGRPFYPYPTNLLPGVSDNFASGYPVPGLGFDYAHFFAVHPNWGRLHPVDGVLLSWGGSGGFYMPVPYYTESAPPRRRGRAGRFEPAGGSLSADGCRGATYRSTLAGRFLHVRPRSGICLR